LEASGWLGAVGGVLEITGFALVATELVRAQRRELGHAGPFQFLLNWASGVRIWWRKLRGKTVTHEASAHVTGTVDVSGQLSARTGTESEALEDRVRVLEENFRQLDAEVESHRKELDDRIGKETDKLHGALGDLRGEVRAEAERQKAAFADSAKLQWLGIW